MRYQAVNNHICQLKNLEIHTVLSKEWQFQTNTEEEYYTNFDFPKIPWFFLPDIWCWFPICWLEIVTTDMVAIHQLRIPAAWSGAAARDNYLLSPSSSPADQGHQPPRCISLNYKANQSAMGVLDFDTHIIRRRCLCLQNCQLLTEKT